MDHIQAHGLHGVVHGKTIELSEEPGLPNGQAVQVFLYPELAAGEGLRQSAGGWSDAGEELDRFLEETRRSRRESRG